ncbi:hypothetical protein HNO89_003954 [Sporosarcina luteola]|nr:hypothetical protein [Sporosarcina luteola]
MKDHDNGVLYVNMFLGTAGLLIMGIGLLKFYQMVGGIGASFALVGFPLTMIYLHHLEEKAGISKKVLQIRSFITIILVIIIYFFFFK